MWYLLIGSEHDHGQSYKHTLAGFKINNLKTMAAKKSAAKKTKKVAKKAVKKTAKKATKKAAKKTAKRR